MSFAVYLTNYNKEVNSTGRVASSAMNQFTGNLKQDCSILNPVITLDLPNMDDNDISKFNWAYIPKFHRYYWITDIVFVRNLWEFHMSVDVLASYRDTIAASNCYVLRSASASDGSIIDSLYPVKTGCDVQIALLGDYWEVPSSGSTDRGAYVIGVVSTGGQYGSITYYVLSRTGMVALIGALMNDTIITANGFSLDDASLALQKSLIDPLSYIKSCVYIPVNMSQLTLDQATMQIYDYTFTNVPCYKPLIMSAYKQYEFTRPTHPDTNSRGNYVNCAPYTLLTLNIPPFGLIELDTSVTCNIAKIGVLVTVDLPTGKGRLEVIAGDSNIGAAHPTIITSVESQIGVPVILSQVTRDYVGAAQSILSGVGSILSGNFLGAAAGVGSAVESVAPHMTSVGQTGSFSGLWSYGGWNLTAQFYRPAEDDPTHHGRPLCQNRVLSTVPGYLVIQDADLEIPIATEAERLKVKEFMESGFYLNLGV